MIQFSFHSTVVFILALLLPALLQAGGKGSGGTRGKTSCTNCSISLVLIDDLNGDGLSNVGDTITFDAIQNVVTDLSSTSNPFISVSCYQGSNWVYVSSYGLGDTYPWAQYTILASNAWQAGPADCTARLYTTVDGSRTTTLATLNFHVNE
jgi:hypothetical protein